MIGLSTAISTGTSLASSVFSEITKHRQQNQDERLAQGTQSGQLTPAEQARLARADSRNDARINQAMADGTMDAGEFARIMQAQNVESARIEKLKNDADNAAKPLGPEAQSVALEAFQRRQERIDARLQKGVESGKITSDEKSAVEKAQAEAQSLIDKVMADNVLTRGEFGQVMGSLDVASRQVASSRYGQPGVSAATVAASAPPANYKPLNVTV